MTLLFFFLPIQLTLMDAVCLLLALPEVAYNFLHKRPSSPQEWIIHVLASREISISHVLRRHFWWYKVNQAYDDDALLMFKALIVDVDAWRPWTEHIVAR